MLGGDKMIKFIEENDTVISKGDVINMLEDVETAIALNDEYFEKCIDYVSNNLKLELEWKDFIGGMVKDFIQEMDEIAIDEAKEEEELQKTRDRYGRGEKE